MNSIQQSLFGLFGLVLATQAAAQITFYEGEGFRGRAFTANGITDNFRNVGFNDLAASVIVDSGRWEVCDDARFGGRCMVLRKGSYETLTGMGMSKRISSVRPVDSDQRYENESPEPMREPNYEYRRRPHEDTFEAQVTSVHAVMNSQKQHCWVERHEVAEAHRDPNVGGAIFGAILGGVLGHQVGGGRGRDLATVGGAIAGGALGTNVGGDERNVSEHDVRRCDTTGNSKPEYWDVTYLYQGQEHRIQMSSPPGAVIAVNRHGEPRQ